MPGDDGLVLLDRLTHAHPRLPVVVLSAYTDVASTAGAFPGSAPAFLSTPLDLDATLALARRALAPLHPSAAETPLQPETVAAPDSDAPARDPPALRQLFPPFPPHAQASA